MSENERCSPLLQLKMTVRWWRSVGAAMFNGSGGGRR
jgi:hypothetical protein